MNSFSLRSMVYAYLDFKTLATTISGLSKLEREDLLDAPHLTQKRTLMLFIDDPSVSFSALKYNLALATKVDLRVQNFDSRHCFILGTILALCREKKRSIELNVWVDKDLDVQLFIRAFHSERNSDLLDFIYYRCDQRGFSYKLSALMRAFDRVKTVQFSEIDSSTSFIDTKDLILQEHCQTLKYTSLNEKKAGELLSQFPSVRKVTLRFQNFLNQRDIDLSTCSQLLQLRLCFPNSTSLEQFSQLRIALGPSQTNVDFCVKMTKATVKLSYFLRRVALSQFKSFEAEFGQVECEPGMSQQILHHLADAHQSSSLKQFLQSSSSDDEDPNPQSAPFIFMEKQSSYRNPKTPKKLIFVQKLEGTQEADAHPLAKASSLRVATIEAQRIKLNI